MLKRAAILLGIGITAAACSDGSDVKSKSNSAPAPAAGDENVVAVAGTLVLDTNIAATDASELTPGGPVAGATVFLKDFPEQSTTSDATGAFELAVDISSVTELNLQEAANYTVVMWFRSETTGNLYGVNQDVAATPAGDVASVGQAQLTFTNGIHWTINDSATNAVVNADCTVTADGFTGRVTSTVKGPGLVDSDYLPADDYSFQVSCPGYETLAVDLTVPAGTVLDDWISQTVSVTATP